MSQLEVDKVIPQSGTTLTIGDSGDTITIASGATLSGDLTGITNLTMSGDLTVDTNTLFVDASADKVGINTTSPARQLTVSGSTAPVIAIVDTGTSGSPSLFFGDSSADNVGKIQYANSDNSLAFVVNSSERARIDSSGRLLVGKTVTTRTTAGAEIRPDGFIRGTKDASHSLDVVRTTDDGDAIRIYKDNTNVGVIGTQKWGIGIASPSVPLDVNSSSQTTLLHLNSTAGTSSAITFANTGSNDSIAISAESDDLKLRTDDGNILFAVAENSEKMRITSAGLVGIGNTAPVVKLHVGDTTTGSAGSTGKTIISSQDFSTTYSGSSAATWSGLQLVNHDDTSSRTATGVTFSHRSSSSGIAGIISTSASADRADIRFITRGSNNTIAERMRIDDDGHVICPEGVTLGTAVGTHVAANTLDDYEEGTWTPAAANTSDWSGFASSTVTPFSCTYTKIGRKVTIQGGVSLPDSGDSALAAGDFVQFSGLPFAYGGSGDNIFSKIPSQLFRRDGTNGGVTHGGLLSNTQIALRVVAVHGTGRRRQQGLNLSFSYFTD